MVSPWYSVRFSEFGDAGALSCAHTFYALPPAPATLATTTVGG